MENTLETLSPDGFYHIYNRANGNETLFANKVNYHYFLQRYKQYISPFAHTYAYCLMPNHFHLLIHVKEEDEIIKLINEKKKKYRTKTLEGLEKESIISRFLSQQFSHLFNAYTQAFNKQQGRRGGLFMQPFKRKQIQDEKYLIRLVCYIHHNPVAAGLADSPGKWAFSSYKTILSDHPTLVCRAEIIEWFENRDNFIFVHKNPPVFDV